MPKKGKKTINKYLPEKVRPKPRRKQKSEITFLDTLEPGDRFEFINLKRDFRNLFVKRTSWTAVYIGGEIKERVEGVIVWKRLPEGYGVATSCEVRII